MRVATLLLSAQKILSCVPAALACLASLKIQLSFFNKSLRLQHTTHCFPITLTCVAAEAQLQIFLCTQYFSYVQLVLFVCFWGGGIVVIIFIFYVT